VLPEHEAQLVDCEEASARRVAVPLQIGRVTFGKEKKRRLAEATRLSLAASQKVARPLRRFAVSSIKKESHLPMTKTLPVVGACAALEAYVDRLHAANPPGLSLNLALEDTTYQPYALKPQTPEAIADVEKALEISLPDDVRQYLLRGLRGAHARDSGDNYGWMGFQFLAADQIIERTEMLRDIAEDDDEHAAVIRGGVSLTYDEPQLVVAADGVYHFSFRNPLLRVASSWGEFLDHWLAAGCFSGGNYDALWSRVGPFVQHHVPFEDNTWLQAYKTQFPDSFKT
jgi:hypothetical protein